MKKYDYLIVGSGLFGAHTKVHHSSTNIKGKAAKDAKNKEEKEKTK